MISVLDKKYGESNVKEILRNQLEDDMWPTPKTIK
jgi:hypothetical protein